MSTSLMKIVSEVINQAASVETMLIESGGEITEQITAALQVVDVQLPEKIDGYSFFLDRLEQAATYYRDKAAMYSKMACAADTVIGHCEMNLKIAMTKMEVTEIQGIDVRYKMSESAGAVVYTDENLIDAAYKTVEQVTVTKIDKKRISEDLKIGVPVLGCRLEKKKVLKKYANSPGRKKKA